MALSFQNNVKFPQGQRVSKALDLSFRNGLSPSQRVFWDYVYNWKQEPDSRPSKLSVFEEIFGGKIPETRKLVELESELPAGRGKILFSSEDAAMDIVNFYKRYFRDPLKNDIDSRSPRRKLLKYFSQEEMKRLASSSASLEQRKETACKMAEEVLSWIDAITLGKVMEDIEQLLNQHRNGMEHVRSYDNNKETRSCEHKSEYMELKCFLSTENSVEDLIIRPVRGFRIWVEHKWEPDYVDVIFPEFHVCRLE